MVGLTKISKRKRKTLTELEVQDRLSDLERRIVMLEQYVKKLGHDIDVASDGDQYINPMFHGGAIRAQF